MEINNKNKYVRDDWKYKDWDRYARIKQILISKRMRLIDLANDLAIKPTHIYRVIRGVRRTPRIEKAIAKALGVTREEKRSGGFIIVAVFCH